MRFVSYELLKVDVVPGLFVDTTIVTVKTVERGGEGERRRVA